MLARFLFRSVIVVLFVSLAWGQNNQAQNAPKNGGDFSNNLQPATKVPPECHSGEGRMVER